MVLCSVPDEEALKETSRQLTERGVRHYMFVEDDFGDQATALSTEPIHGVARKVFSKYPLWREMQHGQV
jgi:hypothetical protein